MKTSVTWHQLCTDCEIITKAFERRPIQNNLIFWQQRAACHGDRYGGISSSICISKPLFQRSSTFRCWCVQHVGWICFYTKTNQKNHKTFCLLVLIASEYGRNFWCNARNISSKCVFRTLPTPILCMESFPSMQRQRRSQADNQMYWPHLPTQPKMS